MRLAALAALVRAAFLTATSYRLRFVQSILTSVVSVVPVFFVARALQPMMGPTIKNEGSDFFAFLVVGFVVMSFVVICVDTLPTQVGSDINNGFFEALLGAPVGTPSILVGMVSYPILFTDGARDRDARPRGDPRRVVLRHAPPRGGAHRGACSPSRTSGSPSSPRG